MSVFSHFRRWYRQLQRAQAFKKYKAELREFVYLDEVSVYSLIASQLGPIAAEFTETQTKSLQGEITGSFGANAGIAKGELSSQVLETRTHGSQVLRRSIVQTQFKELYELEMGSFAMRPISKNKKSPPIHNISDLINVVKTSGNDDWIINPINLNRGKLIEVEVQLEAETIFRVSAVVSAILDIIEENPKLFGVDFDEKLIQAKTIDRILEKLLVGLVPVRGYVVDYSVVDLEGQQWVIHSSLLNQLATKESFSIHPLYVVGVTEQSLFWKDIRRILFAKARFRVLCRIASDNIQTSWVPVKLVQVLETVAPDIARQIDDLGLGTLSAMSQTNLVDQNTKMQRFMNDALVNYAQLLAGHYKYTIAEQDLLKIDLIAKEYSPSFNNQKRRREAFEIMANFILGRMSIERDPLIVAEYRAVALADVGLDFSGQPIPLIKSDDKKSVMSSDDRFIDSEFVAIYW